jgi:flagellar hook-associated protein 2
MAGITASGLGSGLDVNALVGQLVASERAPQEARIKRRETQIDSRLTATGTLRGALSTLQGSLSTLKIEAAFQARKATSADATVFSATAGASSVAGTYGVEVRELASAHKLASQAYAGGSSAVVGTGTLTFTQGGSSFSVTLAEGAATLGDLRGAINRATGNTSVQATIINASDGARLVLTSRLTGEANAIEVVASGGDGGLEDLEYVQGSRQLDEIGEARDAEIRVDGFTVTSASNAVAGAIEGVTLELQAAKPGTTLNLTVANDTTATRERVQKFVTDYNTLASTMSRLRAFDPNTRVGGPLLGDAMLRGLEATIRRELGASSTTATAPYDTLSSIGVAFGSDGSLKLDEAKLNAALAADYGSVGRLFGSTAGVAARLNTVIDDAIGGEGQLTGRTKSLNESKRALTRERDALDERMQAVERRYRAQFTALDSMLSGMQSTSRYLAQQLG